MSRCLLGFVPWCCYLSYCSKASLYCFLCTYIWPSYHEAPSSRLHLSRLIKVVHWEDCNPFRYIRVIARDYRSGMEAAIRYIAFLQINEIITIMSNGTKEDYAYLLILVLDNLSLITSILRLICWVFWVGHFDGCNFGHTPFYRLILSLYDLISGGYFWFGVWYMWM